MCKSEWLTSTGVIKYDPPRPGMKRRTDWWAILKVDREITRYYRWWVKKELHVDLCQPSWDAHISIIRGEKPRNELMHLWKKYDGKKVKFRYRHHVRVSGDTTGNDRPNHYWFVDIDCPQLTNIRKELKMPCKWSLHLTIGRTW